VATSRLEKPAAGDSLPIRNPRSGEIDTYITPPGPVEIAVTCARLREKQEAWGRAPLADRIAVMKKWADRLQAHKAALIEADSTDTGYGQISRVAPDMVIGSILRSCVNAPGIFEQARHRGASAHAPHIKYDTNLRPYPLAGIIGPWNAPLMLSTLHAVPALFAGCAVIVKPSEVTPRFVKPLRETIEDVNFTGSVPNGRKVAEACARRFIPAILELGGKDPVIVTETADLHKAARAIVRGAVTSTGQVCFSIERIYVQEKVHDAFVDELVREADRVQLNYPDPQSGQIGPFISERQSSIVDEHLDDAVRQGAQIRTGGKSENLGGGLYMRATVLTGVTHQMKIMLDETFGPVMPVMKYSTEEEAIRLANDTTFGLSAAVIAGSEPEARRIADRLDAGLVSIQDTFLTFAGFGAGLQSDSFKFSGMGSRAGILAFIRKQGVLINCADPACLIEERLAAVR
jgi:succinate-semialdehyde dehydrogenase / glutarate-semialdehyde dehydrogenase